MYRITAEPVHKEWLKVLLVQQTEVVVPFFERRDFAHLEQWLDPSAELSREFAPSGLLPMTILFDADGKELLRVAGEYEWDSEEAIAQVREALAGAGTAADEGA